MKSTIKQRLLLKIVTLLDQLKMIAYLNKLFYVGCEMYINGSRLTGHYNFKAGTGEIHFEIGESFVLGNVHRISWVQCPDK